MKTLIVGTGRSGTGWCAEVLNRAGIKCGHQAVFKHAQALGWEPVDWGDWEADSSYEAVPMLHRLTDVRVILVVRHPLDTIRSWLEHGAFGDDMATRFRDFTRVLQTRFPQVLEHYTPIDRAAAYWLWWNRYADAFADATIKLEFQDAQQQLLIVAGSWQQIEDVEPSDPSVSDKVTGLETPDWSDISQPLRDAVEEQALLWWGYR